MTNDRTNIWQIRDAISIMNADATAGRQEGRGQAGKGGGQGYKYYGIKHLAHYFMRSLPFLPRCLINNNSSGSVARGEERGEGKVSAGGVEDYFRGSA